MSSRLPTTLVFLDTEVYVTTNFNFQGPLFSALKERIEKKQVTLGITEITIREVQAKIREGVAGAYEVLEKAKGKAHVLKNSSHDAITAFFRSWSKGDVEDELQKKFLSFLSGFEVERLGYDGVAVEKIFDLYFGQQPPFGEAKKKNEFPDAFALSILEGWAECMGEVVHIVSNDGDIREGASASHRFTYSKTLAELLAELSFKYDELAPLCLKAYEVVRSTVENAISDQFLDRAFYLGDQDGEVEEVYDVEVGGDAPQLLWVSHDEGDDTVSCEFEIVPTISYRARLNYNDLSTATYDSEDKVMLYRRTINEDVDGDTFAPVTVELTFLRNSPDDCTVDSVKADFEDSEEVTSSVHSDFPWK